MTDDEIEVVEQAVDQAPESEDVQPERQPEQEQEAPRRRDVDYNWGEARRNLQEKDRLIREQQETISRLSHGTKSKDEDLELSNDDILTVGQAKKLEQIRDKKREAEYQRQKQEILQLKYPDIEQVLTPENIAFFEQTEPELAETLCGIGDPIKMKAAAYRLIKKTIKHDAPPSAEKRKAELNVKKPVSVQSISKGSAIGNAHLFENGLTPELRKQMWKETQEAAMGY